MVTLCALHRDIFSPDTDIDHVGLSFTHLLQGMDVVIQLTKTFREGTKFLLFHNLVQAIHSDPDLQGIPFALRKHYNPSMYAQDVIMCLSLEAWGK